MAPPNFYRLGLKPMCQPGPLGGHSDLHPMHTLSNNDEMSSHLQLQKTKASLFLRFDLNALAYKGEEDLAGVEDRVWTMVSEELRPQCHSP